MTDGARTVINEFASRYPAHLRDGELIMRITPEGPEPLFVTVAGLADTLKGVRRMFRAIRAAQHPNNPELDLHICRLSCDSRGMIEIGVAAHDAKWERDRTREYRRAQKVATNPERRAWESSCQSPESGNSANSSAP